MRRLAIASVVFALLGACELVDRASDLTWPESPEDRDGGSVGSDGGDSGDGGLQQEAPCDSTAVADEQHGVFVSPSPVGDDLGAGTPLDPVASLGKALSIAAALPNPKIFLSEGTYREAVEISLAGVTIEGGWTSSGASWSRNCQAGVPDRTVVLSPTNLGMRVRTVASVVTLDSLTVATKSTGTTQPGMSGESLYGLWVDDGGLVRLRNVVVRSGIGGAGSTLGSPNAAGNVACDGVSDCSPAAPVTGQLGMDGTPAGAPPLATADGLVASDGQAGSRGGDGQNGTAGTNGQSLACNSECTGEGGVCGGFCGHIDVNRSSGKGKCGCGGSGGAAGQAGKGGGSSVGLFLAGPGSTARLEYATLVTGQGGAGSVGSAGGAAGPGGAGSDGAALDCPTPGCGRDGSCNCVQNAGVSAVAGGAAGGTGARGGDGGAGGGGAGGSSFGILKIGGASVSRDSSTPVVVDVGAPGIGAGGAANGETAAEIAK